MGRQTRADQPEASAALIAEILELADRLRASLDAPCEQFGVSASRYGVLTAIEQSGAEGCSQTELAARLGLSESNVSALVEGLRRAGLLFRFRSKTDRRRSVLLLTEDGTSLVAALSQAREVAAGSLVGGLTTPQIAELRALLSMLGSRLEGRAAVSEETCQSDRRPVFRRAS